MRTWRRPWRGVLSIRAAVFGESVSGVLQIRSPTCNGSESAFPVAGGRRYSTWGTCSIPWKSVDASRCSRKRLPRPTLLRHGRHERISHHDLRHVTGTTRRADQSHAEIACSIGGGWRAAAAGKRVSRQRQLDETNEKS